MPKPARQIIVDPPANTEVGTHADLANAIWAISPDGASVTVVADDAHQVNHKPWTIGARVHPSFETAAGARPLAAVTDWVRTGAQQQ